MIGRIFRFLIVLVTVLMVGGCNKNTKPDSLPASVQLQKTYYSQVGMHYEKGRYRTTNYGVGIFLPVNSKVQLLEMGSKGFDVKVLDTGEAVEVINHVKHTNDSVAQAFEKLFSEQPVSLLKFNAMERANIEAGTIAKGMSKDAVIVARGYPPAIETPNLKRDQWKYWKNRWDTILVSFKNGKVSNILD